MTSLPDQDRIQAIVINAISFGGQSVGQNLSREDYDAEAREFTRQIAALYLAELEGIGAAQSPPCGEASADAEVFAGRGVEPSAAEEALFAICNQLGAAKTSMEFNGNWVNAAGYITDAALWIERSISAAEEALTAKATGASA